MMKSESILKSPADNARFGVSGGQRGGKWLRNQTVTSEQPNKIINLILNFMFRDKINLREMIVVTICLAGMTVFSGCDKDNDNDISYPYTEYEILHLGNKSGLTSSSSDQAFRNGLNEVLQTWIANNPSTGEVVFDGVTYEFTNIQEATGAIPKSIWDVFWKKLGEFSYSIGSCWGFSEAKIPSKGGTGTAYVLYTIVTQEDKGYGGEVLYIAFKCNVSPKPKTRSAEDNAKKINELIKSAKIERKLRDW
jgi:hypothetical protein